MAKRSEWMDRTDLTPSAPSDDASAVPARFAACRTLRHAWEPSQKVVGEVNVGLRALALVCLRCTTTRIDGINHMGTVKSRKYTYPEGYLRKKGDPKLYTTDYRLAMLQAALADITIRGKR